MLEQELSEETEAMLNCLKPQDRELFQRLFLEEQDVDTVSRETGMKKEVIYNRVSRGKKKIRKLFI
jgi:RNA polymerase sigma-70 factor (ECF subfamily)